LNLWIANPERGKLTECYEMIPFLGTKRGQGGPKKGDNATTITMSARDKAKDPALFDTVVIDRGGFGVRIELDQPRPVQRGLRDTLLISLIQGPTPASKIGMSYRIVPFWGP
jgi:hypothetical protein